MGLRDKKSGKAQDVTGKSMVSGEGVPLNQSIHQKIQGISIKNTQDHLL